MIDSLLPIWAFFFLKHFIIAGLVVRARPWGQLLYRLYDTIGCSCSRHFVGSGRGPPEPAPKEPAVGPNIMRVQFLSSLLLVQAVCLKDRQTFALSIEGWAASPAPSADVPALASDLPPLVGSLWRDIWVEHF